MSTVCKFYLRGNCKYGHRCHFLHEEPYDRSYSYGRGQDKYASQQSYGNYYKNNNSRNYEQSYDEDYSYNNQRNSYSRQNYGGNYSSDYHSTTRSNYANNNYGATQTYNNYAAKQTYDYNRYHVDHRNAQREPKNPENITPVELLEIVNFELTQHERSRAWPFTVIAPVKEFGNVPGFKDCSPEEVRFQYTEALSTNTLFEYEKHIRDAQAEIEKCRQVFRSKSSEAINIVRTMMQQSKTSESSGMPTSFASTAATFTFDVRKLHETQPTENMEALNFPNASLGAPNQTFDQFFMNSTFSTNEAGQQSVFGLAHCANAMSNQFQSQSSIDTFSFNLNGLDAGQPNLVEPITDNTMYSNLEGLPPDILESFQARAFKVGKIPIVPPPRQLCFSLC